MTNHLYILGCILFTVCGQLLGKWRMNIHNVNIPHGFGEKLYFYLFTLLLDPYIIASYSCGLIASFFWLLAIGKLQLSYAYPFMSLAFVLVAITSSFIFKETLDIYKIIGTSIIILGLFVLAKGYR